MNREKLNTEILQYTESITNVIVLLISFVLYCFLSNHSAHQTIMLISFIRLLVEAILVIAYGGSYAPYFHSVVVPLADYITMICLDFHMWGRCLEYVREQFPYLDCSLRELFGIFVFSMAVCVFVALHDQTYILSSKYPLMTFSMINTYYIFIFVLCQVFSIQGRSKRDKKSFATLAKFQRNERLKNLVESDSKAQGILIKTLYVLVFIDFVCHFMLSVATVLFILSFDCEQEQKFLAIHLPGRALEILALLIYMCADPEKIIQISWKRAERKQHKRRTARLSQEEIREEAADIPTNAIRDNHDL